MNMHAERPITAPTCPYCGGDSELVTDKELYGRDYGGRLFWRCVNFPTCDTYVGCHPGTAVPLGTMANKALRDLRKQAQEAFDRLWTTAPEEGGYALPANKQDATRAKYRIWRRARERAYAYLAMMLGIEKGHCHIGEFDALTCERVIHIASNTTPAEIRDWAKGARW